MTILLAISITILMSYDHDESTEDHNNEAIAKNIDDDAGPNDDNFDDDDNDSDDKDNDINVLIRSQTENKLTITEITPTGPEQNVLWLQVAMNDADFVEMMNGADDLRQVEPRHGN